MTSVMSHKKFSRCEFPLMDPLPDKSWEDPESLKDPPDVRGVTKSVVKGEEIEHFPNQHTGVNLSLYNELERQCTLVEKYHKENVRTMTEFKDTLMDENQKIVPALEEFTKGIREPARVMDTVETVSKACGLSKPVDELMEICATKKVDRASLSSMLLKLTRDGTDDKLSRVERSDVSQGILQEITSIVGPAGDPSPLMTALEKGCELLSADVLQYLNLELSATTKDVESRLMKSKILSAKRGAALTIGDKETVAALEEEMESQLYSVAETQHSRIQSIILCNGDIEEHAAQVTGWNKNFKHLTSVELGSQKAAREQILDGMEAIVREMRARESIHHEKQTLMVATQKEKRDLIKENTRKQDELVTDIIERLQLLPLVHQERVQLIESYAKEVEAEASRVTEYEKWTKLADTLLEKYKEANEVQQNLIAGMQVIDREGYLYLSSTIDDKDHEDVFHRLELDEAKQALHIYSSYATASESILGRKEAAEEVLERDIRVLEMKMQTLDSIGHNPEKTEQEKLLEELQVKKASATEEIKIILEKAERNAQLFEPARGVLASRSHKFHDVVPELKEQAMKRRVANSLNTKEFLQNERRILSEKDKQNAKLAVQQELIALERSAQAVT